MAERTISQEDYDIFQEMKRWFRTTGPAPRQLPIPRRPIQVSQAGSGKPLTAFRLIDGPDGQEYPDEGGGPYLFHGHRQILDTSGLFTGPAPGLFTDALTPDDEGYSPGGQSPFGLVFSAEWFPEDTILFAYEKNSRWIAVTTGGGPSATGPVHEIAIYGGPTSGTIDVRFTVDDITHDVTIDIESTTFASLAADILAHPSLEIGDVTLGGSADALVRYNSVTITWHRSDVLQPVITAISEDRLSGGVVPTAMTRTIRAFP